MKNTLISLAVIVILATPGPVFGAAKTMSVPDLTVGTNRYAVNRSFTYNLGPTGMRGWIWTKWSTYNRARPKKSIFAVPSG